ncbi:hypothetical protein Ais01nite_70280 [Asanoa ishikariensis]|nr:hypothetical protein Ais01nite_70280 [Asanoa ishikariensis]
MAASPPVPELEESPRLQAATVTAVETAATMAIARRQDELLKVMRVMVGLLPLLGGQQVADLTGG